jgi:drug/metabolite transporter (DMT)-like permease
LFIILACTCWAFDTYWRYPLLQSGISAITIVFYEHLILALIFTILNFKNFQKIKNLTLETLFYFLVVGGVGSALATISFTKAFEYLNPSVVIILQKLQPFCVILFARIFLKESWSKKFLIWASLAIFGSLFISFYDLKNYFESQFFSVEQLLHQSSLKGYLFTILAVLGWSITTVMGKKLTNQNFNEKEIMTGRFLVGFMVMIPLMVSQPKLQVLSTSEYGSIGLMVLISALIGMFLYYKGLKQITAKLSSIGELFFPLSASIINWALLGIELKPMHIVGGIILIFASIMIQVKKY